MKTKTIAFIVIAAACFDCGEVAPNSQDSGCEAACNDAGVDATIDANADVTANDAIADVGFDQSVDAAAWSPGQLPGICVWLNDDVGLSGTTVGSWKDQSGQGNDAVQTNAQLQPLVQKGGFQSHDVVQMANNRSLQIADATCLHFATQPFFIAAVAALASNGGSALIWHKLNTNSGIQWYVGVSGNGQDTTATSHTASVTYSNVKSGFHLMELAGPAFTLTVDSILSDGGLSTEDLSSVGQYVTIGQSSAGEVDLAELVVVSGTSVSSQDLAKLNGYFANKFGL